MTGMAIIAIGLAVGADPGWKTTDGTDAVQKPGQYAVEVADYATDIAPLDEGYIVEPVESDYPSTQTDNAYSRLKQARSAQPRPIKQTQPRVTAVNRDQARRQTPRSPSGSRASSKKSSLLDRTAAEFEKRFEAKTVSNEEPLRTVDEEDYPQRRVWSSNELREPRDERLIEADSGYLADTAYEKSERRGRPQPARALARTTPERRESLTSIRDDAAVKTRRTNINIPDDEPETGRSDLAGNDNPLVRAQGQWGWLALCLLALFFSIGANIYLGWIAWDTHARYQDLVDDLHEAESQLEKLKDRGYSDVGRADFLREKEVAAA